MKRFLYSLLLPLSILCSCIYEDEPDCCRPMKVRVEMAVRPDLMMTVTRADEATIRDLNFYLYDDNGNVVLHRYQTSATLRFECLPGSYRIRIAANMGRDLGENPASEDFTVSHADEYDVLPMSYEGDVAINSSSGGVLALPAVEVWHCVAKISYHITVAPAVADIELRSIQLLSVPRSVSVFDMAAAPSDDPDDYTDCPETELSGQQAVGDCYLLSNMQGIVASITDQRQKNPDNAPANASYLLIRAVRGEKVLAYYIYLGGNNTSDFNVRANCHYRLNISILGDNEVDTSISSYAVNVHDTYEENAIGGYCVYNPSQMLAVEIDGSPAPLTLRDSRRSRRESCAFDVAGTYRCHSGRCRIVLSERLSHRRWLRAYAHEAARPQCLQRELHSGNLYGCELAGRLYRHGRGRCGIRAVVRHRTPLR